MKSSWVSALVALSMLVGCDETAQRPSFGGGSSLQDRNSSRSGFALQAQTVAALAEVVWGDKSCPALLVAPNLVLSSMACDPGSAQMYQIRIGGRTLNALADYKYDQNLESGYFSESYSGPWLIELGESVTGVEPIRLYEGESDLADSTDTKLHVSGETEVSVLRDDDGKLFFSQERVSDGLGFIFRGYQNEEQLLGLAEHSCTSVRCEERRASTGLFYGSGVSLGGGEIRRWVEAHLPSARPSRVSLDTDGSRLVVSWDRDPRAVGYELERYLQGALMPSNSVSLGAAELRFADPQFHGKPVCYRVRSTGPNGWRSSRSQKVCGQLESANTATSKFHNIRNRLDVNADNCLSPIDALMVISHINTRGSETLSAALNIEYFPDTDNNGTVTPMDATLVITALNNGGARCYE